MLTHNLAVCCAVCSPGNPLSSAGTGITCIPYELTQLPTVGGVLSFLISTKSASSSPQCTISSGKNSQYCGEMLLTVSWRFLSVRPEINLNSQLQPGCPSTFRLCSVTFLALP